MNKLCIILMPILIIMAFIIGILINPFNNYFDRKMVQEILVDYQGNLYKERTKAYNEAFDNFYDRLAQSNIVLQKTVWVEGSHLKINLGNAFIMVKNGNALVAKGHDLTFTGGHYQMYGTSHGINVKGKGK